MNKTIKSKYKNIKKYLHNTLWILSEKFIGLGVVFLVAVVVARYLGPENFGIYSYVVSIVSLFAVAGHMGLSGLVVRELVNNPAESRTILGTTFTLKIISMSLGYILLLIYAYLYEGFESVEFLLISILGLTLIIRCFDVIDFWFQSYVKAKYVSISGLIGLSFSALLKLLFVFFGFGLTCFILANVLQVVMLSLSLIFFYSIKSDLKIKFWSFSWKKAKELLSQGWLVYLGSIFAILNLKLDQVMLKWYQGAEQVGIYAVAAQLSEAWYFIPTAIVASFFPKLISLRDTNFAVYQIRLQQLFSLLFLISIIVAAIISLGSKLIIDIFFGESYSESANVLVVHIWAAVFIFMRALFSRWILIENVLVFSLITQGFGAVVNIVLNYFWINQYGVMGAAYATLISYASSSFFALLFYRKTRPIFWMMCKAISLHSILFRSSKNEKKS